jgi:hypothetical protein
MTSSAAPASVCSGDRPDGGVVDLVFFASAYRDTADESAEVVRGHVATWGLYDVTDDRYVWDSAVDRAGLRFGLG